MKDDTHERILDGTTELVARHGFRPGRVEEIAEYIGVSVKTIYNHFGSKRALVLAVVQRNLDTLFDRFNAVLDRSDLSFAQKLHQVVALGLERARSRTPGWFGMLGVDEPAVAAKFQPQLRARFYRIFTRLWEEGREAGAIADYTDPETMSYTMLFLVEGFLRVTRDQEATIARDELLRRALRIHLFGLLTPEAQNVARNFLEAAPEEAAPEEAAREEAAPEEAAPKEAPHV
jgi:AcrR family transcriptional regulator